jgi:predicted anti-sigma-YlaC factor YlaD
VECEVAREALSARIDGEREPVPAARVDEHLDGCAECRSWLDRVSVQAATLRRLAATPAAVPPLEQRMPRRIPVPRLGWPRWALLVVGAAQLAVSAAQAVGMNVGLAGHHGMGGSGHLLNESTAWSIALGVVMIGAAVWPGAAAGLAGVLATFAAVLTAYVVADAFSGAVTLERVLSHLPIVAGALLAFLVWRSSSDRTPAPRTAQDEPDITLPHNASRGRRRGHLWSTDGAA